MADAVLCHNVRRYLEQGHTLQHIYDVMGRKGHSTGEINAAVKEFYKDEETRYDDNLIKEIEKRFKNSQNEEPELIQNIFADLAKEGHKPFEIEKAMLRAKLTPKMKIKTAQMRWNAYSIIQVLILTASIILAVFYKVVFALGALAIIISMISASLGIPKIHSEWRKEYGMIPGIGLWTRDGIFGYNSITGNYWRWRVLDPAIVVALVFVFIAVYFFHYGIVFILICIYLALLSLVCFTIKPPDSSGPPYRLITQD